MFQELLPLLPKEVGTLAYVLAVVGAIVGLGLWLVGARYSRSLVTLVLVSVGGWIGLLLPRWFGWSIEGWATAIMAALVLGGSAFVIHRFWVGMGLGLVMAGWAAVAVWLMCKGDGVWSPPKYEIGLTAQAYVQAFWSSLPNLVQRVLPVASGAAMLGGLFATLFWPRLGTVLLYSAAGVTMIGGTAPWLMNRFRPQWLNSLPATKLSQAGLIFGLFALGALIQWTLVLSKKGPREKKGKPQVVVE
jgi:hypothetical protein